ncbi:MAG: CRISPR-associated endonuclease Cas2 [Kiritimatiellia bacterium]
MLMLISYDVSTTTTEGRKRLRQVAKLCQNWGTRVQNSVFECHLDWTQWLTLKAKLETSCDPKHDSLRYYNLGNNYKERIIHYGAKPTLDTATDLLII